MHEPIKGPLPHNLPLKAALHSPDPGPRGALSKTHNITPSTLTQMAATDWQGSSQAMRHKAVNAN